MIPKTKLQIRAVELSKQLPDITPEQKAWGIFNCLSHMAYRTARKTNCLDCGHSWATKTVTGSLMAVLVDTHTTCPSCGVKLEVKDTKHRIFAQREFYSIISTMQEFQVVRIFEIRSYHKSGEAVKADANEVCSQWILPDGRFEYIARLRGGMGWNQDGFSQFLEIRGKQSFENKFNIFPTKIHPKMKVLPVFKRNGFSKDWHHLTPFDVFNNLGNTYFETLLKANQTWLLQAWVTGRKEKIKQYWPSIKICLRNDFKFTKKNVIDWLDYITLLDFFGKDLRNADYVCPANLNKAHNRYVDKKREADKKEALIKQQRQLEEDTAAYITAKKQFFGLYFGDDNLMIKVLESVEEFMQESQVLKHCLYSNKYYSKENSLILSARIDGKPVETIEIDLATMKITQSRGLQNAITKHHKNVIELVTKNLPAIRKAKNSKKLKTKTIAA